MHVLMQKGKVIFKSENKIDVIYEHQKYFRRHRVIYKYLSGTK